jgi:cation transport regulator ChaB
MPYEKLADLPDEVRALPKHAQEIWRAAFNAAFDQYDGDEEKAFATAWAAVKAKYRKEGGRWVLKGGDHMDGKWIAVFRTGKHTDSAGNEKDWTEQDLDQIVSQYNPAEHEAPLVIGHPTDNAPAYGWVDSLKHEGGTLYARFKQLVPEFVDMVKRGLFKKRSVALYPDLVLRHIGFLGAMPPAVKGLPDVGFKHGQVATVLEFEDEREKTIRDALDRLINPIAAIAAVWNGIFASTDEDLEAKKKFNIAQQGKKPEGGRHMSVKDKLKNILSMGVDNLPDDSPLLQGDEPRSFTEAELKAKEEAAAEKARKEEKERVEKEFAEKQKKEAGEKIKAEITEFIEAASKDGKLLPAWQKLGIAAFMESLDHADDHQFAEEGDKQTQYAWFKHFLEELPKVVTFKEVAGRDKDVGTQGAGEKLDALTKKKMTEDKDLKYSEAFEKVQEENPELANKYAQEVRGTA